MKNIIGILGGMGPEASCHIYKMILQYCQEKYGAVQDEDYPRIVLNSLSLKGFSEEGVVNEGLVKGQLVQGVQMLQNAHCDYIIIACNTVHIYYDQMQESIYTPIINVVEETIKKVYAAGHTRVLLLGSKTTCNLKLYQKEAQNTGIKVFETNTHEQESVTQVIKNVMGGKQGSEDISSLREIIDRYKNTAGVTAVILGCTELPLAINQSYIDIQEFNANDVLVQTVVEKMYKTD